MENQATLKTEGMVYENLIPIKGLCSIDESVKSFEDLSDHFLDISKWIKKLEADGWTFNPNACCDGTWVCFEHTDRNVAVNELGEEYVQSLEESWLENEEEEQKNI